MAACRPIPITATTMPEGRPEPTLLRLLTWMSPAFPVGAFAYSHGLERAIHDGLVKDRATLADWLQNLLQHGSAWNDAVLLAESWRETADGGQGETGQLAEAMAGSRERHMETTLQGEAFLAAVTAWPGSDHVASEAPYPVAVGRTARMHGISLEAALSAYLHGFTSSLIQAAMRLVPLGQSDGVATIAALEETILDVAQRADRSTLDDLGSATMMADIMAMKHETQYSRLFRS